MPIVCEHMYSYKYIDGQTKLMGWIWNLMKKMNAESDLLSIQNTGKQYAIQCIDAIQGIDDNIGHR